MATITILGGRQRKAHTLPNQSFTRHGEAVVVTMDVETGETTEVVSHVTPAEARPEEQSSIVFKSGTLCIVPLTTSSIRSKTTFSLSALAQKALEAHARHVAREHLRT